MTVGLLCGRWIPALLEHLSRFSCTRISSIASPGLHLPHEPHAHNPLADQICSPIRHHEQRYPDAPSVYREAAALVTHSIALELGSMIQLRSCKWLGGYRTENDLVGNDVPTMSRIETEADDVRANPSNDRLRARHHYSVAILERSGMRKAIEYSFFEN